MIVYARFTDTAAAVDVNGYPGLIYFIIFLYLSSYQIFRLFVAIIAQSFELDDSEKLDAQVGCSGYLPHNRIITEFCFLCTKSTKL
jgi:hypothetical protein